MQTVHVNGVDLRVLVQGEGRPMLFVHGFPLDHSMWRGQLGPFARRHRTIAPDLRGFGQSDVTEGAVTMQQFADDLAALLDELHVSEPVTLCGLSMGGYVALEFARKYRQRLSALVLCDTKSTPDSEQAARQRAQTAEQVMRDGPAALADQMLPRLFSERSQREQTQRVEQTRRVILGTSRVGIAAAALGMAERSDTTGVLRELPVPALLVVGEEDAITPPETMRELADVIPRAGFVSVPHAGHLAPLEAPSAVNAALQEFLNSPAT